jgi:hypothetical protein
MAYTRSLVLVSIGFFLMTCVFGCEMLVHRAEDQHANETVRHATVLLRAIRHYAATHEHSLPPTLGALADAGVGPHVFFTGGTRKRMPEDFAKWGVSQRAEWIDLYSEFQYMAAGRKDNELPEHFVIFYVKPSSGERFHLFIKNFNDFQAALGDQYDAAIIELANGQNPPPSLR